MDLKIDRESMGKLAKTLTFICGADNDAVKALKTAAESGNATDIKKARAAFLKLKSTDRQSALMMLRDSDD